jgi:outer membrane protein
MSDLAPISRRAIALLSAALLAAPAAAQQPVPTRLSLGEAVALAADRNAAVHAARFRADQADARVRQRRADILPNLSASAVESGRTFNTASLGIDFKGPAGQSFFDPRGQVEGPVNTLDVRGRLTQSLFDLGAVERIRAARAAADASDADIEAAAEQAAGNAAVAYLRALRADAAVAARRADSTLASELLSIAEDQLRAGIGIALDVTRARAQAAQIRGQLITAENDRSRAALDLSRVLALPVDASIVLTDSLTSLPMDVASNQARDLAQALGARPELRALDAQVASIERTVKSQRMERLPTISAFADDGIFARNGGKYLPTYSWGLQLSLPIFDGFRREARVEEQSALKREYDVRRRDLHQQFGLDLRGAEIDLASAREQLAAARERLTLAEQELVQARDRFRAGVAGNADVVTASLGLNAGRILVIDALSGFHSARIALARAQGSARTLR